MAKFLFVYRNPTTDLPCPPPSPEEMQAAMVEWGTWFQSLGENLIDGGDGLNPDGKVLSTDGTVTDGPFIEAKELVGGYSIVQADSFEAAVEMARTCPVTNVGASVEIRQLAGYAEITPEQ